MIFRYGPAKPEHRQFIVSGWSSSLRKTRDLPFISMADYADIMHSQIVKVLERAGAQTIVAERSVFAGFICFERGANLVDEHDVLVTTDYVFYVYVAQPFRRRGLARFLFAAAGIDPASRFHYAARTKASWQLASKTPRAHYSSYYARYSPEENERHAREHREAARRKGRRRA